MYYVSLVCNIYMTSVLSVYKIVYTGDSKQAGGRRGRGFANFTFQTTETNETGRVHFEGSLFTRKVTNCNTLHTQV